jgi:2-polyprenyl-3-methyl-5-hydroxy-6-metoxy-1,4-benzoquinol methylase
VSTVSASDIVRHLSTYDLSENEERYLSYQVYRYAETLGLIVSIYQERAFKKVLDVGTGFGHMASTLKYFCSCEVYAIDFQAKLKILLEGRDITFKQVNLEEDKIPFDEGFFDLVLFCEVIEHLNPLCVDKLLNEIHRVLSDEGLLLLTTPTQGPLSNVFNMLIKPKVSYSKIVEKGLHTKVYRRKELHRILEHAGFRPITIIRSKAWERSGLTVRDLPSLLRPVRRMLGCFPALVECDLMAACRKSVRRRCQLASIV